MLSAVGFKDDKLVGSCEMDGFVDGTSEGGRECADGAPVTDGAMDGEAVGTLDTVGFDDGISVGPALSNSIG